MINNVSGEAEIFLRRAQDEAALTKWEYVMMGFPYIKDSKNINFTTPYRNVWLCWGGITNILFLEIVSDMHPVNIESRIFTI